MRNNMRFPLAIIGLCLALFLIGPARADTKAGQASPEGNVIRRSWSRSVTVRRQALPPDRTAARQRVEPAPLPPPRLAHNNMGPDAQALLFEHNLARSRVGVRPLAWNARIAAMAGSYAERLARTCRLEHSRRRGFGENLFVGTAGHYSPADGVRSWIAEARDYDYRANSGHGKMVGHYTQIVWNDTTEVGCGRAVGCGNMWLVCNYYPPGNYAGRRPY